MLKKLAYDMCRCLLLGGAVTVAALVVLTTAGAAINAFQIRQGLEIARSGLFVLGSVHLFICAGMLIRPKLGEKWTQSPSWRKKFRCFGLTPVVAVFGTELILTASVLDYWLYFA